MIRVALFLMAALALAACATPPPTGPVMPDPKTQMAALETRIAVLVEEERQKLEDEYHQLLLLGRTGR